MGRYRQAGSRRRHGGPARGQLPVHADLLWDAEAAALHTEVSKELGKLHALNTHAPQLERALAGLLTDGLATMSEAGYQLPN